MSIDLLLRRYADIVMRQAWSEYAEIMVPDATFVFVLPDGAEHEVRGPAMIAEFGRRALKRFSFYEYIPLNHVATLIDEASATGRTHCLEIGRRHDGTWIEYFGRYEDRYAKVGSRWVFAERRYHSPAQREPRSGS